jgi:hypothetical protein
MWAGTSDRRDRDNSEELFRVVCWSSARNGYFSEADPPHERVAWPELHLVSGATTEDYLADSTDGARQFTLWSDPERGTALARCVTLRASREQGAEYEIRGADSEPLAVIRRESGSFWRLRRARWTIRQLDQGDLPPATARRGRILWWCAWLPFLPFQRPLVWFTLGSFDGVDPPRRLRFRRDGKVVLDYHGVMQDLAVRADWWDPRVTAALTVLIHSFDYRWPSEQPRASFA